MFFDYVENDSLLFFVSIEDTFLFKFCEISDDFTGIVILFIVGFIKSLGILSNPLILFFPKLILSK